MSGPKAGSGRVAFVTGVTGVVGPGVVRGLAAKGWTVRALVRRAPDPKPDGIETVVGDLGDETALTAGLRGADAVVHLAALLHINDPSPRLDAICRRTNVDGTRRLVDLASAAGVGRFVFASTINVYGPSRRAEPWTEVDDPTPRSVYAETKLEAEGAVRQLGDGVVFRLAAVVGPGMRGNYPMLLRALGAGVRVLPGDGENRRTLIHLDDAADAFTLAATGDVPAGTYNVTDGRIHPFDQVVRSLQAAAGRRPGVRYVPAELVRTALRPPTAALRLARRPVDPAALVDKVVEDIAVSGDLLVASSPYSPTTDTLAGWLTSGRQRP